MLSVRPGSRRMCCFTHVAQSTMELILFMSRRMSLRRWAEMGIFWRELALYRELVRQGVRVNILSYGDRTEQDYQSQLPGMRILCNDRSLPRRMYEQALPWVHRQAFRSAEVIKTNQTEGAEQVLRARHWWRRPLIARCGYMFSSNVAAQAGASSNRAQRALRLESKLFNAAHRIVVTTSAMAADVRQRLPEAAGKIRIVPNYVDVDRFSGTQERAKEWDLIYVGRLSPEKNVEALLEAIRPLRVRLLVVGSGPLLEPLKTNYRDLADRVTWLDHVPHERIPDLLARSRAFVLPSHFEGHPKAALEAMVAGVPVIGTNVRGIRELIQDRFTGLLSGTDPASMRGTIRTLLADEMLQQELSLNGQRFARAEFSLSRIVQMELDILYEVTGRNRQLTAAG